MSTQKSIRIPQAESVKQPQGSSPSGRGIQSSPVQSTPSAGPACVTVQASGSGPHASKNRCGFVLRRRYRLDVLTARSALGEHYQAYDLLRRKTCSIKLARLDAGLAKLADDRLRHEAGVLARLSHPNIVEARELNIDESGIAYLVLESLEGKSLAQYLEDKGRLPFSEALELLRGLCTAMGRAHDVGVIHGDLRPGCIFLQKQPKESSRPGGPDAMGCERVKVIDFELSCEQGSCGDDLEEMIPTFVLMGSFPYRAPEALTGDPRGLSPRSDIWSIAVIAYRMLSGRLPFASEDTRELSEQISFADPKPLSELLIDVPASANDAIMTALSKSRCLRFSSAADFLRALEGKESKPDPLPSQKASPTGLFEVTPQLLAECRQNDASSGAVPVVVSEEHSTRRYPQPNFPQALLEEASGPQLGNSGNRQGSGTRQVAQQDDGSGRILILGLALLSILFGTLFAVGFIIAQRVRSPQHAEDSSACANAAAFANASLDQNDEDGNEMEDAELRDAPAEKEPAPAETWVPVAPPPVSPSVFRSALMLSQVQLRPQASVRRASEASARDAEEALPPPADAPPFATEARDSAPQAEAPNTSTPASTQPAPMRIQIMD